MTTREWTPLPDDANLTRIPCIYGMCENELAIYVKAFESYRITAWECMRLVIGVITTRPSPTKMVVKSLDPPYPKTPCRTQTYRTKVMADGSLHCENMNFRTFLLLWPWPWPDDLHIRTWPVLSEHTPDVHIWTSYLKASNVIVWQTYRQTDKLRVVTSGHVTKIWKMTVSHTIRRSR